MPRDTIGPSGPGRQSESSTLTEANRQRASKNNFRTANPTGPLATFPPKSVKELDRRGLPSEN